MLLGIVGLMAHDMNVLFEGAFKTLPRGRFMSG